MSILSWFTDTVMQNSLMIIFVIAFLGYLIGRITVCGLNLGTAGILLVALVFGHFGYEVPKIVGDLGLICFVTSVGLIAGPKFFRNFKVNAKSYILLGFIIIATGKLQKLFVTSPFYLLLIIRNVVTPKAIIPEIIAI